jgi:hypothetical protein
MALAVWPDVARLELAPSALDEFCRSSGAVDVEQTLALEPSRLDSRTLNTHPKDCKPVIVCEQLWTPYFPFMQRKPCMCDHS